jgi:hypothetical protein
MKTTQYMDMVSIAMRSDKDANEWFTRLRTIQKRQTFIRDVLKRERPKHPGLTNAEILKCYGVAE